MKQTKRIQTKKAAKKIGSLFLNPLKNGGHLLGSFQRCLTECLHSLLNFQRSLTCAGTSCFVTIFQLCLCIFLKCSIQFSYLFN